MNETTKHSFRENIISQVNYKQIAYTRELIYEELCKHLKAQGLYLDHEMFRAILCCCNELTRRYTANPDVYREDTRQLFNVSSTVRNFLKKVPPRRLPLEVSSPPQKLSDK